MSEQQFADRELVAFRLGQVAVRLECRLPGPKDDHGVAISVGLAREIIAAARAGERLLEATGPGRIVGLGPDGGKNRPNGRIGDADSDRMD